jgi:hypothetical protein
MADNMIGRETLVCPKCGDELTVNPDGSVLCKSCGMTRTAPHTLCPQCLQIAKEEADVCVVCGAGITTVCPGCGRVNWAGAGRCVHCGRDLNALDHAFRSFRQSYDERVEIARAQMPALRHQEEEGSRRRMQELAEIDRRRLLAESERVKIRKKREQRLEKIMIVVVIVFFILLALLVVFGNL